MKFILKEDFGNGSHTVKIHVLFSTTEIDNLNDEYDWLLSEIQELDSSGEYDNSDQLIKGKVGHILESIRRNIQDDIYANMVKMEDNVSLPFGVVQDEYSLDVTVPYCRFGSRKGSFVCELWYDGQDIEYTSVFEGYTKQQWEQFIEECIGEKVTFVDWVEEPQYS